MAITMRVNEKERELIKQFAELNGLNVSEYIRKVVMEKIEDEFDIKAYEEAMAEFQKDKKTYTLEEVKKIYGQNN